MTYHKRLNEWLKPLVIEIKRQRPEVEIVICINGELNYFNEEYRKSVLDFLKEYKNVFPIMFPRFRSFSRMVNLGVQFSSEETVLVLSDDITLDGGFFDTYERILERYQTFGMNTSFSAFSITKKTLTDVGWFDERLLGMGWEDGEFFKRYNKHYGEGFPNATVDECKNIAEKKHWRVYNERLEHLIEKEEGRLEGQKLDTEFGRYSKFNHDIFEANLPYINPHPIEAFYLENKDKL